MNNEYCPWVEKHRPTKFDDVVLDPLNKCVLKNIIETSYFPNLLFYGPPGTGKTTTIINLINTYQEKYYNTMSKGLMIHLNASDERGIDIIRNQISSFVNSKPIFQTGMKFVILDEVDYMTKNAQQALRYLLQCYSSSVRFCLICNYISKIDEGLQNEFLKLRFNQLPEKDIVEFLKYISKSEKLDVNEQSLIRLQKVYNSDIRSMLNFMQSNQNVTNYDLHIIDSNVWDNLINKFLEKQPLNTIVEYIQFTSINYNIDKKNIIKVFLNFIVREKLDKVTSKFMEFSEKLMHFPECNNDHYINYAVLCLLDYFSE
jgi:replication factor C subunit 3/5